MAESKFNYDDTMRNLMKFYKLVRRQILRYQSPTTGLFPCDLSMPNPVEAHVRDSIYCATAIWALAQSFKRIDDDKGRTHELAQSAVKCMRGILACWLRQADKVEKFKKNQSPKYALHSRFHLHTGDTIYKDDEFEHLQLDCVSLYLMTLVQMITSGLQIIFTTDEVHFMQNLVFYIERAYRTPDFGMWERGNKYHTGSSELHASSIGMVKAALEAVNGTNIFGLHGANWSTLFIDIDAHFRNRINFNSFIPRESHSKNTDSSLIPTVSWPAFAIHEESLVKRTLSKIERKLKGKHGFKRFLRDGYGTIIEDKNRKYYRPAEIKCFDGIECEWPIFFAYMIIDSIYRGDTAKAAQYNDTLQPLLRLNDSGAILPRYYYVERENIDAERAAPGSQPRVSSNDHNEENVFLWGQSVYIISQLLLSGLLNINELDPIRRYLPAAERPRPSSRYSSFQRGWHDQNSPSDLVIQVALISESVRLQQMLATYGIQSQTPHQIEPVQIWAPSDLARAYEQLGVNEKLGLSGRPPRPIGGLGSAKIYRACGILFLCYPLLFQSSDFYLSFDMELLVDDIKSDLAFLAKCWKLAGRPTFCMIIREDHIRGQDTTHLFSLLAQFKRGDCDGIRVRLGRLQEFISSACIEHLDFFHVDVEDLPSSIQPFREKNVNATFHSLTHISPHSSQSNFKDTWTNLKDLEVKSTHELQQLFHQTDSMHVQAQVLRLLLNREGLHFRTEDMTVEERLEVLLRRAGNHHIWAVVRFCSSLLGKTVDSLAPSITAILVRGKLITIGVFGQEEEVIDKPLSPQEIKHVMFSRCFPHDLISAVIQQELILNIGAFISTNPRLFDGILKIRIGWIIQVLKMELSYTQPTAPEDHLYTMAPSAIKALLLKVLTRTEGDDCRSVIWRRQLDGGLNRVPPDFYDRVWQILERSPNGLKVAGYKLPQQPTLSDMTQYELNFSLLVEQMLSKIVDPSYRQLMVESFMVVAVILERNAELSFQLPVDMDELRKTAFDLFQHDRSEEGFEKTDDLHAFYSLEPNVRRGTTSYMARAVVDRLLEGQVQIMDTTSCAIA